MPKSSMAMRHAHGADRLQAGDTVLDVLHDQAFGDLQFQPGRRVRVDADHLLDLGDEAAIAQLQRRHVHRDAHRRQARGAPAQVVCDGLAQRPAPDVIDQSGFFQDRDEAARRHQAGARIVPADQRLGAGELAAHEVHLGLVMEHELFLVRAPGAADFPG